MRAATRRMLRVLLVEDEPLVREMVGAFLVREGYAVATAESAEDALDRFGSDPFDVLLTDVMLPGQTGVELATKLRDRLPDLKVVYMSGNISDAAARQTVMAPGTRFIAKPFARAALLDLLRSLDT